LKDYKPEELILVLEWVFTADAPRAVYLRDNNYTDIIEIFRLEKVDYRLEQAQEWNDLQVSDDPPPTPIAAPILGRARRGQ
jgi:hypothetical protein